MYQDRLRVIQRRLGQVNRDMTRDRQNRDRVPPMAHVQVLQASIAVQHAIDLCTDADHAADQDTALGGGA